MSERVEYEGRDLEAMSLAVNYHRWIFESMKPWLGSRLVEVGAGSGSFSELLLESSPDALCLVEPSEMMHEQLRERLSRTRTNVQVETYNATFSEVAEQLRQSQRPDSILYINVLEHIREDEAELALTHRVLANGGRVLIFVPALAWLYGKFDERVGHVRRYGKAELEEKASRAGFKIIKSGYFDLMGVLPWFVKYRILKSDSMESWAVKLYDRYAVNLTRAVESAVPPPLGKNILLIAEKI